MSVDPNYYVSNSTRSWFDSRSSFAMFTMFCYMLKMLAMID